MLYDSERGEITLALAGDIMLTRQLSVFKEARFLQLCELFRGADASFANFESCAHEYPEGSPTVARGTCMTTEPKLLADMKWFGINIVSTANNHAFDYGEDGVLACIRHLDEAGVPHAGTGRNLREARSPAYLDTRGGRVALIAATAFFNEWNQAGEQRADLQGRPGVNPLAFESSYVVDAKTMDELKRMGTALGFEADKERHRNFGFISAAELGVDSKKEYHFLGKKFTGGAKFAVETKASEQDIAGNLRQVREARRQADWVIVSLHNHEMGGPTLLTARKRTEMEECASFVKDFAHRCIDEGADVFIGHGPHVALGMELYKGKPIFYSLGDFIMQNETVRFFPAHGYSRFGLDENATPADFLDARSDRDTKAHPADPLFWQTICAVCKFASGKLKQITLYPVDIGYGRPRPQRGRPLIADAKTGEEIIARIARLSKDLGTEVVYRDGCGIVGL
ncbi:MAG: CapA family protein [Chloroflexota bacterium]|nr:CapA family protein [Chloroflexota bacterium]